MFIGHTLEIQDPIKNGLVDHAMGLTNTRSQSIITITETFLGIETE